MKYENRRDWFGWDISLTTLIIRKAFLICPSVSSIAVLLFMSPLVTLSSLDVCDLQLYVNLCHHWMQPYPRLLQLHSVIPKHFALISTQIMLIQYFQYFLHFSKAPSFQEKTLKAWKHQQSTAKQEFQSP